MNPVWRPVQFSAARLGFSFAICVTVAEVALGLAIVILLFRTRKTAMADHVDWLKG